MAPCMARIPLLHNGFRWPLCHCSDRIEHMQAGWVEHETRIDALLEVQRRKAALAAREQLLLHELASTAPPVTVPGYSDKQWIREELACVLRIAPCTAGSRLLTAEQLVTRLPATLAALEAGVITFPHALRLCEATGGDMPAATVAQIEAWALARAEDSTVPQFTASIRYAVAKFDRRDKAEAHQDAVANRRVCFTPHEDGSTDLWACLPSDAAAAMREVLGQLAARSRGLDERSRSARV